jgi:hypothetical protein
MKRLIIAKRLFDLYRRAGNPLGYALRRAWRVSAQ